MKVLLLAGTTEARALSHALDALDDVHVVVSLAGRTSAAADHGGTLRVGGFGGVDRLETYLLRERFDAVVDATHPFATRIAAQAADAARRTGLAHLRVERPPWRAGSGDRWTEVADVAAAARVLPALGAERVLLTIGRTGLGPFLGVGVQLVVRSIEAVDRHRLPDATFVEGRGPFTVADELALLDRHAIDTVVTKNSGGDDAKLTAAREHGVRVVMISRPPRSDGATVVDHIDDALHWLRELTDGRQRRHRPRPRVDRDGRRTPVQGRSAKSRADRQHG